MVRSPDQQLVGRLDPDTEIIVEPVETGSEQRAENSERYIGCSGCL